MLELSVNGQAPVAVAAATVSELLLELGYREAFVAVAVNHTCVRRSAFSATPLSPGDAVEILSPMAGG